MDYIVSILTSKWFIVNTVISICLLELALYNVKFLRQTKPEHKARDDKFLPFKRNDLHLFWRPILYLCTPTFVLRIVIGVGAWAILALIMKIVLIGRTRDEPLIGWKLWFLTWCSTICSKINLMIVGCWYVDTGN
jgi:1-acyl-sn-glycerol-3-phosphate acyltransferase